jgi:hypothetical protein
MFIGFEITATQFGLYKTYAERKNLARGPGFHGVSGLFSRNHFFECISYNQSISSARAFASIAIEA